MYTEVIDGRTSQLGAQHTHTLDAKNNLAIVLADRGERDEARRLYTEVIEGFTAELGAHHTRTLNAKVGLENLLQSLTDDDQLAKALALSMETDEDIDDEQLAKALALLMETEEDIDVRRPCALSMVTDAPSQLGRDAAVEYFSALMKELRVQLAIELSDDASVLQIACRELGIKFQPSANHFELAMQLTNLLNGSASDSPTSN